MENPSRRRFLKNATIAAAACAARPLISLASESKSPFRISVINDEISQDFDHVCYVVAHDFGLSWIELRTMWNMNTIALSDAQINAPISTYSSKADLHGAAETTFKQQDEILERSISLAKQFKTDKVRCFDFWRLDDVAPYREAIDEKLRLAAEVCGKQGILLLLENEFACNTATGREAARTMNAIGIPPMPSCAAN